MERIAIALGTWLVVSTASAQPAPEASPNPGVEAPAAPDAIEPATPAERAASTAPEAPLATTAPLPDPPSDDSVEEALALLIGGDGPFTLGGWIEAYYAFNFNEPSNGITNLRGFDNRHNTFQLANVLLDLRWDWENIVGRIALQWGTTPSTYYLAEPARDVVGSGVGDSSLYLWQWLQEAHIGYRIPVGTGLLVEAGLFTSPIGPESLTVHDDFNFSRSNLCFGLPFYHAGIRATYAVDRNVTLVLWAINGWNAILDGNDEKSFALQMVWEPVDAISASFVYLSGVERPFGAAEREQAAGDPLPWRHTFDANVTASITPWLSLVSQLDGGFEPTRFGLAAWAAGALALRAELTEWLDVAARGDVFWENVPSNALGTASPIFWNGAEWVSSGTLTVDLHPEDHFSFRIEYRHDHAASPIYYAGAVASGAGGWISNTASQDTLTFGTTAWF